MHFSKSFYQSVALGATVHADLVFRGKQSSACISILNFPYSRFASNRASEYRNKTCSDSVKRRRLKTRGNSAESSIFGISNAAEEFSRDSFFQQLIITGGSSYLAASSLSVSCSLMAFMSTFTLNLASYFFLSASWRKVIVFNLSTCIRIREYYTF